MADESTKKPSPANPTVLAMDHPITLFMLIVGLLGLGALAFHKMQMNIFPKLNEPKIYVYLDFIGMSPDQIEGFIINELERLPARRGHHQGCYRHHLWLCPR